MGTLWNCPTCNEQIDIEEIPPNSRIWHNHQTHKTYKTTTTHDPSYRNKQQPRKKNALPQGQINSWMSHKDRTTKTLNVKKINTKETYSSVACQICGQLHHIKCANIQQEDIHNYVCTRCNPNTKTDTTTRKTFLSKETNEPPFMSKHEFSNLCKDIKKIQRKQPATKNHIFTFRNPTITWELLAGSSAHSFGCRESGYPQPSVAVERTKACDPVLRANCGPTLEYIFRYIQSGHTHSVPLPSYYAYHHLNNKSRSSKEKGRKRARNHEKYTLDLLVACLICTPYTRMGLQNGFKQGAGRAFCEVLKLLTDTPTNIGMTEQCTEFTTAEEGKVFSLFLNCLIALNYEIAWRIHNTSHGGMPQDRKRVYVIYIKKPGPSPSFLMDLDLNPTENFKYTQSILNSQREFPSPTTLVQFPLHQTKYAMPIRTDGKTGSILTGPRRTAFAAQYRDNTSETTTLTTLSGPIHISNLLSLQELPQNHLSAAPSLNAQYSALGNSCSGEIALQQLKRVQEETNKACQIGKQSYKPHLTEYATINASFTGNLHDCIQIYRKSPGQYNGACTNLKGEWMLFPKLNRTIEPMCTLSDTITKLPLGARRELDSTNITYFTPKEAAHVLFRSMDSLNKHPWLVNNLFLAAGQSYADRLEQEEATPPERTHEDPEEIENIDTWTEIFRDS
jgi:site-specific DNA-cytosine methylase